MTRLSLLGTIWIRAVLTRTKAVTTHRSCAAPEPCHVRAMSRRPAVLGRLGVGPSPPRLTARCASGDNIAPRRHHLRSLLRGRRVVPQRPLHLYLLSSTDRLRCMFDPTADSPSALARLGQTMCAGQPAATVSVRSRPTYPVTITGQPEHHVSQTHRHGPITSTCSSPT